MKFCNETPATPDNFTMIAQTKLEVGTEVEVGKLDGYQKRIPATVVRFPFYDPDKSRVRS